MVDLDGAATGELEHFDIIKDISTALLIPVQVGGGIRRFATIEKLLKAGVDRVILGTAALENEPLVKEACSKFEESVIIGIDTREGLVSSHGWQQESNLSAAKLAESMFKLGARRFIHTDISRDGTLTEPNFASISELISTTRAPVIASGGISSINHLKTLSKLGCEGAIVGKALYTKTLNLKEALAAMSSMDNEVKR